MPQVNWPLCLPMSLGFRCNAFTRFCMDGENSQSGRCLAKFDRVFYRPYNLLYKCPPGDIFCLLGIAPPLLAAKDISNPGDSTGYFTYLSTKTASRGQSI